MRTRFLPAVVFFFAACASVMALEGDMWWNDGWRFRTTVVRSTPWRDDAPCPVEAVVDFARLLEGAGVEGEFDPASVRVIEPCAGGAGVEIPFAYRSEFDPEAGRAEPLLAWTAQPTEGGEGLYHIYFDTRDRGITPPQYDAEDLPSENLLANSGFEKQDGGHPAEWTTTSPALVKSGRFAHTTGERSLKIVVDENTPETAEREFSVNQRVDVRQYAGREMVFECDLFAEHAPYGAPVSIEIQQFRADGSRLLEYAVQSRWLTIELAQGQLVQFRERGRFSPDAVTANVRVQFRCLVRDADTQEFVTGSDSFFTLWLDRMAIRPGERWSWPGETNAGYVTGALEEAPFNRAFEFTGVRRLFFNGASEGSLQSGTFNPNPKSVHWGLEAGTVEFWCRPSWDTDDQDERVFYEGTGFGYMVQSRISKVRENDEVRLRFSISDAGSATHRISGPAPFRPGQWHHVAATWDLPKAQLQIFFDGKRIASRGPGPTPWPSSLFATGGTRKTLGVGLSLDDTRSLPRHAYIGGERSGRPQGSVEAALDEFRVSSVPRYHEDFAPPRSEFALDDETRALFHFENERDGIHGSDDRFVRGHLVCELAPHKQTATLETRTADGAVEGREVLVNRSPDDKDSEAKEDKSSGQELPDPRFIEYTERRSERIVRGEDDAFVLNVGGDLEPLMQSVTFEHAAEADGQTVLVPHWRANDNVVPFSIRDLAATLAPDAKDDAERAMEVFNYAVATSYYYVARYCETFPTYHRDQTWWAFLKALNIYPHNECGPLNYTLRKLFLATGISSNNALGTQHQFQQAFYLGQWRLFDSSTRTVWFDRDGARVVGRPHLERDLHLMARGRGFRANMMRGEPYEAMFGTAERPHSMAFPLRAGERAAVCWHNEGRWFELKNEREPIPLGAIPPRFGNGAIVYLPTNEGDAAELNNMVINATADGATLQAADSAKPASLVYSLRCPYILTDAVVNAAYEAAKTGSVTLSLSVDEGRTWERVWVNDEKSGALAADLLDHVTARYEYLLKLNLAAGSEARVAGFRVRTTFAVSPLSLPGKLSLGQNRITFTGDSPAAPVKSVCRWLERRKTDLGVSFNTLNYPMLADQRRRNLLVARPGQSASLVVSLEGRPFDGKALIEGLPEAWLEGASEQQVTKGEDERQAAAEFRFKPEGAVPGEIRKFDVVLREGERERREAVQVLVADSPLVREAEAADEVSGAVEAMDLAEASAGRVMKFTGDGSLCFAFSAYHEGKHALWVRARWKNRWGANVSVALDDAQPRSLRAARLRGSSGWRDPNTAYAKALTSWGGEGAFWYRIPDVNLTQGEHVLTLGTDAEAEFDVLVLLPETAAMDRAATNLFHNWNYAPWQNPF